MLLIKYIITIHNHILRYEKNSKWIQGVKIPTLTLYQAFSNGESRKRRLTRRCEFSFDPKEKLLSDMRTKEMQEKNA